ncbi:MAG: Rieske 2Fe-2S domain-containing protein [Bacteroidota bacterium]
MEEIVLFENKAQAFQVLAERAIKKIRVDKKEFGISRFNDEIYVFDVACPHAAYDLTSGKTSPLGTIVCPWHNYQYRLNSGEEIENRCGKLKVVKTYYDSSGNICFRSW